MKAESLKIATICAASLLASATARADTTVNLDTDAAYWYSFDGAMTAHSTALSFGGTERPDSYQAWNAAGNQAYKIVAGTAHPWGTIPSETAASGGDATWTVLCRASMGTAADGIVWSIGNGGNNNYAVVLRRNADGEAVLSCAAYGGMYDKIKYTLGSGESALASNMHTYAVVKQAGKKALLYVDGKRAQTVIDTVNGTSDSDGAIAGDIRASNQQFQWGGCIDSNASYRGEGTLIADWRFYEGELAADDIAAYAAQFPAATVGNYMLVSDGATVGTVGTDYGDVVVKRSGALAFDLSSYEANATPVELFSYTSLDLGDKSLENCVLVKGKSDRSLTYTLTNDAVNKKVTCTVASGTPARNYWLGAAFDSTENLWKTAGKWSLGAPQSGDTVVFAFDTDDVRVWDISSCNTFDTLDIECDEVHIASSYGEWTLAPKSITGGGSIVLGRKTANSATETRRVGIVAQSGEALTIGEGITVKSDNTKYTSYISKDSGTSVTVNGKVVCDEGVIINLNNVTLTQGLVANGTVELWGGIGLADTDGKYAVSGTGTVNVNGLEVVKTFTDGFTGTLLISGNVGIARDGELDFSNVELKNSSGSIYLKNSVKFRKLTVTGSFKLETSADITLSMESATEDSELTNISYSGTRSTKVAIVKKGNGMITLGGGGELVSGIVKSIDMQGGTLYLKKCANTTDLALDSLTLADGVVVQSQVTRSGDNPDYTYSCPTLTVSGAVDVSGVKFDLTDTYDYLSAATSSETTTFTILSATSVTGTPAANSDIATATEKYYWLPKNNGTSVFFKVRSTNNGFVIIISENTTKEDVTSDALNTWLTTSCGYDLSSGKGFSAAESALNTDNAHAITGFEAYVLGYSNIEDAAPVMGATVSGENISLSFVGTTTPASLPTGVTVAYSVQKSSDPSFPEGEATTSTDSVSTPPVTLAFADAGLYNRLVASIAAAQ